MYMYYWKIIIIFMVVTCYYLGIVFTFELLIWENFFLTYIEVISYFYLCCNF